jgi:hypothetical protein
MKLLGAFSFGLVLFSTIPDVVPLPLPLSGQDLYARNPSLADFLAAAAKKKKPHWHPVTPPPKPKPFFIRDDLEARDPTFAPAVIWKKPAFPWPKPPPRYTLPVAKPYKFFRREDDDDDALANAITNLVVADLTKGIAARAFEDLEMREPIMGETTTTATLKDIRPAVNAIKKAAPKIIKSVKKIFSWFRRDVSDDEVDQILANWITGQPSVSARDDDSDEKAIKQLVQTVQNVIHDNQGFEIR